MVERTKRIDMWTRSMTTMHLHFVCDISIIFFHMYFVSLQYIREARKLHMLTTT